MGYNLIISNLDEEGYLVHICILDLVEDSVYNGVGIDFGVRYRDSIWVSKIIKFLVDL